MHNSSIVALIKGNDYHLFIYAVVAPLCIFIPYEIHLAIGDADRCETLLFHSDLITSTVATWELSWMNFIPLFKLLKLVRFRWPFQLLFVRRVIGLWVRWTSWARRLIPGNFFDVITRTDVRALINVILHLVAVEYANSVKRHNQLTIKSPIFRIVPNPITLIESILLFLKNVSIP